MAGIEIIARRYGAALADVVLNSGETDIVKTELTQWATMIDSNAVLSDVFDNPAMPHAQKEKVLESLIARVRPSKTVGNFLRILLKNGRLSAISAINERFSAELEERSGVVTAEVISARELPVNERTELRSQLEKLTGKTVNMDFHIDENIIGGVVTRIGSTVYDGSVRTKLDLLKEQLAGA
jgi:F-type H+-transporting ATPase subunit delta